MGAGSGIFSAGEIGSIGTQTAAGYFANGFEGGFASAALPIVGGFGGGGGACGNFNGSLTTCGGGGGYSGGGAG